jgi:hypothetical protein
MDHFRTMGWTEAEIFQHFTQGSLELDKRYGHEGETEKMYREWEGQEKTTEQIVKEQGDPRTPVRPSTYAQLEDLPGFRVLKSTGLRKRNGRRFNQQWIRSGQPGHQWKMWLKT